MKNFTLVWVLALTASLTSCFADRDDAPEIVSEWKLIEISETIDSTGTAFVPTDRLEIVSFLPHLKVSRNPSWCAEDGEMAVNYSDDGFIYIFCNENETDALSFEIQEEIMVITAPNCIDGCRQHKYQRTR